LIHLIHGFLVSGEGLAEAMALLAMPGISQIVMVTWPLAVGGRKKKKTWQNVWKNVGKTMGFHRNIINHEGDLMAISWD
jgi:hypothetical protein